MNSILKKYLFLQLALLVFSTSMFAQKNMEYETEHNGTSLTTPYNTIYTHLFNLQEDSYTPERSAICIQGNYTKEEKINHAIRIKKILDGKGIYIDMSNVPDSENYKDSLTKKNIYFLSVKEELIYLEKQDSGWYYSEATIENLEDLYRSVYPFWTDYIDNIVPSKYSYQKYIGLKLWQWFAIILFTILSYILYVIFKLISLQVIKRFLYPYFKEKFPDEKLLIKLAKNIALILSFSFLLKVVPSLSLPLEFSINLILINRILLIFFLAFFMFNFFKLVLFYFERAAKKTDTKLDNQLLPIISNIGRLLIYIVAIYYVLEELEVNVTALLAGLSVGGLAIALASKDTVQNIIGSVNIFLDRPFEIGDYIKIADTEGEVEEVGMRATRIRTQNQSLAYIPNGILANMTIDNFGLRVHRRWITSFGLEYDTDPEKIEEFIQKTIDIVNEFEFTLNDKTIVKLNNLGASSLDIYMTSFFSVSTYAADLDCKQQILLKILKMAKEVGVEFAFPTQTLHVKK